MRENLLAAICILGLLAACGGTPETAETAETAPETAETTPETTEDTGDESCSEAGPQSPRDIGLTAGDNNPTPDEFPLAPPYAEMNICDIHYHRYAEHKASGYPTLTGSDKHRGYVCSDLEPATGAAAEAAQTCGATSLGDTVEVHWVFTTCDSGEVVGPGLESCLKGCEDDPRVLLRVEGRVFYLTDGADGALDFGEFSNVEAIQVPPAEGAVHYRGSTTGDGFNGPPPTCSPFQVTFNVGSTCSPLDLGSLDTWCGSEPFNETGAHGVRTLVEDLTLLSKIE